MLPFVLVKDRFDLVPVLAGRDDSGGMIGVIMGRGELVTFEPSDVVSAISHDPAAVYSGIELQQTARLRLAAEAVRRVPRYQPRGQLFQPLPSGELSGFPSEQLLRHRNMTPSAETIRLSAIFAGSTIMVGIEQAEKGYACLVETFKKRGRQFAPVDEILSCIQPLGLVEMRSALYEGSERWAPQVQEAIKSGLKDRALRKHLLLETSPPRGLSLAKVSFVLALLGHDCICLDARLMNRMFGAKAHKIEQGWKSASELAIKRYEAVEDAFLKGNRYYDTSDPVGRARAQWMSWESVGGQGAKHSVWLDVVSDG